MKNISMIICALLLAWVLANVVAAQDLRGHPKRGEGLYQRHCLRCHGESGNGMGPEARHLVVPPANFHLGRHRAKTDAELFIAIQDGVLFSPMHAWRGQLTNEQIKDLVAYIRFFAPFLQIT